MPRPKKHTLKTVESYVHDEKRPNTPPVGLVSTATDPIEGKRKYEHDPHIDPQLSWAGKKEGMSFEVPNVSLHIHERIDPQRIIKNFLRKDAAPRQQSLFDEPDNELPISKAIEFYAHSQDWSNRLIAGDSLLVMNSLLSKESMAGKVQMMYFDPPYGIKYNSNFQPFISNRAVKDGKDEDLTAEPEMIKAFRDTWELGIHSYLTYLRDRLLIAHELLAESGSCFVQISDENVHLVRNLMDEIFGPKNFVALIPFKKTSSTGEKLLDSINDYIIWYANKIENLKYRQLYTEQGFDTYAFPCIEFPDGSWKRLPKDEARTYTPEQGRLFRTSNLTSQSGGEGTNFEFEIDGKKFRPSINTYWKTNRNGMEMLMKAGRLLPIGNTLTFKRYLDDFSIRSVTNWWDDTVQSTFAIEKHYVVQTYTKVIERCTLMTSDPGDLVLDITCGSGTTSVVAEEWGRRWITCDTSRVAIALAKQRLMTAKFDYFQLAHPEEGVRSGFVYKTVPHITLKSITTNQPPSQETLYDQPLIEKSKARVTGPFTVEAVPCLRVKPLIGKDEPSVTENTASRTGAAVSYAQWMDEMRASGIRGIKGQTITFTRLEPLFGTQWLQAEGETGDGKRTVICFGPDFGPLEQRQVEMAMKEARSLEYKPEIIVFAAFQFDPEAGKDIDLVEWKGVQILKAQMSADLFTSDLRKKRSSNQSYWLIGQPDISLEKTKDGKYIVTVGGFDYYDPSTGEVESHGAEKIAMWMLDTNYDEQSLLPDQVFFPMKDTKRDWTPLAKALNGAVDEDLLEAYTGLTSLPFSPGEHGRIAVKIVDDRGIESLVIKPLP